MEKQIVVNNISKDFYDTPIIKDISFSVNSGEVLGFLGPNGAGKTTTMRMIAGFLAPTSGSVDICGYDIATNDLEAKSCIGYLPEGSPLYSDMTASMFLNFIGGIRGLDKNLLKQRLDFVIATLDLSHVLDQTIDTLSKGYKRRIGLAQAILHDPKVLILDEPTDGLDPLQKKQIHSLIKSMSQHKTIVISTHILEEVEAICTRAIIIAGGKLLVDDTPANLIAQDTQHNAIKIALNNLDDRSNIIAKIQQLEYVEKIDISANPQQLEILIIPTNAQDITHRFSQFVHSENWDIESLTPRQGKLDKVFCKLIRNN